MYSTKNPVAIQSQKWLVSALLELMQKKSYESITIKEIAQKADLDRSTFYRNFNSKQDVLNFYLDSLAQDYISRISELHELDMHKIFKVFLDFCNTNLDFIVLLRENGLSNLLLEVFNMRLPYVHQLFQCKFPYQISNANIELVLAFNAGGMWNLLMRWIDNGLIQSQADLAQVFKEVSVFNSMKEGKGL